MNKEDLYYNVTFSENQLDAIRKIYYKYFHERMYPYNGKATIALWYDNAKWKISEGPDRNHRNPGIISEDCRYDPLWNEFSDLLPYMGQFASITKMPAKNVMFAHIDRAWRPNAIYFPISGCTDDCVSEYYDLPKTNTENSQVTIHFPKPIYSYAIKNQAVLTNVHEWHGVRNTGKIERIAFGWNFKTHEYSFKECLNILKNLGY